MKPAYTKSCPNCQTTLSCMPSNCWCAEFPAILPLDTDAKCLCRDCMVNHMQKTIGEYLNNLSDEKIRTVQKLGKPLHLMEGIDYHINAQGLFVFSAWYLLRQGGCCGNGCTNCPYPIHLKKSKSSSIYNY